MRRRHRWKAVADPMTCSARASSSTGRTAIPRLLITWERLLSRSRRLKACISSRLVRRSSGARLIHWRWACIRVVMSSLTPSRSGGAGCPLLWPPLPPAAADEGERPRLVGTDPGIKLLSSPSDPTELRQRAMPGSGSVSRWRSQHVAMPGGPRPRAPSTAAKGAWRIIRRW
jgi:hypothetical protein